VRMGHGLIVFPGGAGTAEEVLYLLGILLDPANENLRVPLLFTGPKESKTYFEQIDRFLRSVLGESISDKYKIIVGDSKAAAYWIARQIRQVRKDRSQSGDAYYFNWLIKIPLDFQQPFEVSHESVKTLEVSADLAPHKLAANLRRVFSAVVTGNIKENGVRAVKANGPFEICADASMMQGLDDLLQSFVAQGRMKLPGGDYTPCYRVVSRK